METDLSATLALARTAPTPSAKLAVVKKDSDAAALAETREQTQRAAPPPGQGKAVDKLA